MDTIDVALVCLVVLLIGYFVAVHCEGLIMASPANLQKLIENMKRANSITDRAAVDAERHGLIMDSFEKRLELNGESMDKIAEYDKLMAAMDELGNGGPALETTFPSTAEKPAIVTKSSTFGGMFNH